MKKTKLLTTVAAIAMLAFNVQAVDNFDDVPEEEVVRAVVNVLKKNPKLAYDSVIEYQQAMKAKKEDKLKNSPMTPLEEKVAEVMKDNPLIVVGALQVYEQQQKQEEIKALAETYEKHVAEINKPTLVAGNPNGKYTLVEFFDFSCGYCKQMAPRIKSIIEKNSDVRVIFKPVSFLSPNSEVAAKAAVAASNQGKFLEMYTALMKENRINESTVEAIAKDLKLDMNKYKEDYASKATSDLLAEVKKVADSISMKSVPTLILNGLPLYAVEEVQIQRAIDVLRNSK